MEQIEVEKSVVLKVLKDNKEAHKKEFEEAMSGWIIRAKAKVQEILDTLNSEKASETKIELYLPKPISYEKEYEKAIKMLEYEIRDNISISSSDFNKYFLDEWAWKENFLSNTELYKSRR